MASTPIVSQVDTRRAGFLLIPLFLAACSAPPTMRHESVPDPECLSVSRTLETIEATPRPLVVQDQDPPQDAPQDPPKNVPDAEWKAGVNAKLDDLRAKLGALLNDDEGRKKLADLLDDKADSGQQAGGEGASAAEANNPLANMKAVNFQNYYVPELTGTDEKANTFWVRYAQPVSTPIGSWLIRASLPLSTVPTGVDTSDSGLGDANVFAAYLFDTGNPSVSVGVGPLLGAPTASNERLGTDQWSAGAAAVYFNASSPVVQFGGLVTYQRKIGGSDRLDDVNVLALQPFLFAQLGSGYYLRAAPIWPFNLESGDYHVPFGVGAGKIVKVGKTVLNFFVEPQFTVLHDGPGQPEFQLLTAINIQFTN